LHEELTTLITDQLKLIHDETGYEEFIVGGLWASQKSAEAHAKFATMMKMTVLIWSY